MPRTVWFAWGCVVLAMNVLRQTVVPAVCCVAAEKRYNIIGLGI